MSVAEVLHNSPGFNIWALHLGRLHFMETMLRHEQDLLTNPRRNAVPASGEAGILWGVMHSRRFNPVSFIEVVDPEIDGPEALLNPLGSLFTVLQCVGGLY